MYMDIYTHIHIHIHIHIHNTINAILVLDFQAVGAVGAKVGQSLWSCWSCWCNEVGQPGALTFSSAASDRSGGHHGVEEPTELLRGW